jgi:predicted SAM-dependent methyltransferase
LVNSREQIRLEFGAGVRRGIKGWTYVDRNHNCDLILDLTRPLLFPDNSVTEIYSSHLLEHFSYEDLLRFLKECRRILMHGGRFSAAVPNARLYLESYNSEKSTDVESLCRHLPAMKGSARIDAVNYIAYMDGHHKYMFDEDNLVAVLQLAGFRCCRIRSFDAGLDLQEREEISIYVEAVK